MRLMFKQGTLILYFRKRYVKLLSVPLAGRDGFEPPIHRFGHLKLLNTLYQDYFLNVYCLTTWRSPYMLHGVGLEPTTPGS